MANSTPSANMADAMSAYKDLNVFAIIQSLLESGAQPTGDNTCARRIIELCKVEQQRQLRLMDRAVAKVNKEAP